MSFLPVYTDEAMAEADRHFGTRNAYIRAGGGLAFSVAIHTLELTMRYITGEPYAA